MSRGVNKVILVGKLGRDPELRNTVGGGVICTFPVATSEQWNDKATGIKKEKTEWHRVVAFGRLGEICGEYLRKGQQIYIEGKNQTRSWEQDGVTRYTTEVIAAEMLMLGNSNQSKSTGQGNYSNHPSGPVDDDIPF